MASHAPLITSRNLCGSEVKRRCGEGEVYNEGRDKDPDDDLEMVDRDLQTRYP